MKSFSLILVALCSMGAKAAPIRFEETEITGEYLKPEITVVISREDLNKQYELELKEGFLKKLIQSVQRPPF